MKKRHTGMAVPGHRLVITALGGSLRRGAVGIRRLVPMRVETGLSHLDTLTSLALPKFTQPRVLCAGAQMASARRTLSRARFQVAAVNDGAEAWDTLLASRFDLVVARLGLPTLDGIRLIQRARLAGINTPVIFLSDIGDPFTISERRRLRVAAILGKHCRPGALMAAVKHAVTFFGALFWKPRRLC